MNVTIIGAGASGMMAAIAAARAGAAATLLESMKKPGKKLLLTGNGRCNLTNLGPQLPSRYRSVCAGSTPDRVRESVLSQFTPEDTLRFFGELGVGRMVKGQLVYPASGQSRSVLDALQAELVRLKVKQKFNCPAGSLSRDASSGKWTIHAAGWDYSADRVVLCAGSRAMPETGSDGSGYHLAKLAGHTVTGVAPALTGLTVPGDLRPLFQAADGARTRARVKLLAPGLHAAPEEEGELQWTSYGLSGIAVFQLSRFLPDPPDGRAVLLCDLVPDLSPGDLAGSLSQAAAHYGGTRPIRSLLAGYTHDRVADFLIKRKGWSRDLPSTPAICEEAASLLKSLRIPVAGRRSFEHAQVCAGGVPLTEVHGASLESRIAPGLYFAGELLDVDGPCGGYNLQWAWASGWVAGSHAGR